MNHRKHFALSDEEILSMERVPALEAARYLGMTYDMLTYKLQKGEMPFGTAELKDKWTYYINPRQLYNYKYGITEAEGIDAEQIISKIEFQLEVLKKALKGV